MKTKPAPPEKPKWIRTPIAAQFHNTIVYVRNRFGMDNLPEAWRHVISFLLIDRDPEELCQAMAKSAGVELPELEQTLDESEVQFTNEQSRRSIELVRSVLRHKRP